MTDAYTLKSKLRQACTVEVLTSGSMTRDSPIYRQLLHKTHVVEQSNKWCYSLCSNPWEGLEHSDCKSTY